jgi:phage gpG-like protein
LDKRIDKLKIAGVLKEGKAEAFLDEEDPRYLNIKFKGRIGAILLKIRLYVDLSLFQGG